MDRPPISGRPPLEGSFITFKIDLSNDGTGGLVDVTAKVLRVITDPLNVKEIKCLVEINGVKYGIPLSDIINNDPPSGFQLSLF